MQDQWHADNRDLVKWGVLVHLAGEHQITNILQVACYRKSETGVAFLTCRQGAQPSPEVPLPPEVYAHFRDIGDIRRLQHGTGLTIEVFNEEFRHPREGYFNSVAAEVKHERRARLLVFLDPDTGIAPKRAMLKHVTDSELKRKYDVMREGDLLVLYQHARRRKQWKEETGSQFAHALAVPKQRVAMFACPVLANTGFDVMSLANNHTIDYGRTGLRQTMAVLRAAGIAPVGAGSTLAEAQRGVVLTIRGLRVGFLAYSHFPYTNFVYDPERESILLLNEEALRKTIPPVVQHCDVMVLSFHWGKEGSRRVTAYERNLAHLAVDLGADLIIGHHAHVRGEIERYQNSLIAYCLGNLVFDQQSYGGNEGYILTCHVSHAGVIDYAVLPVRVVNGQAHIDSSKGDPLAVYLASFGAGSSCVLPASMSETTHVSRP